MSNAAAFDMMASTERSLIYGQDSLQPGIDSNDLEFYEQLIENFRNTCSESLLNKRAKVAKEDPLDEIIELHLEVQEFEKQFKECVEVAGFLCQKTAELDDMVRSSRDASSMQQTSHEHRRELNVLNEKLREQEVQLDD